MHHNSFRPYYFLLVLVCQLLPTFGYAAPGGKSCNFGCGGDLVAGKEILFKRTYSGNGTARAYDWCHAENSKASRDLAATRLLRTKSNEVIITYDDFLAHFTVGRDRNIRFIEREDETGIPMDVGAEDVTDGEWYLPDFAEYGPVFQNTILSVAPANNPYPDDFPESTHLFYNAQSQIYDYFELYEEEGAGELIHLGASDDNWIYEYNYTHAPVPMALGLGVFGGETEFIFCDEIDGGECPGYPEGEYYVISRYFEETASGTLHLSADESSPALKLRNTEEVAIYDINDKLLETLYFDYILFYSEAGHYIRAELTDDGSWDGMTSFYSIEYQKVELLDLPVDFLDFSAKADIKGRVDLAWSTASEQDADRFVIERSTDGISFEAIGEVAATGNSTERRDYELRDGSPNSGINYYRIRELGLSGESTYSSIVAVLIEGSVDGGPAAVAVYPNPGYQEVNFSRPADYEIYDTSGKLLTSGRAEGSVDVSALPAGVYGVRIDGGESHRWVKMR